jgi:hypothetical protein
MPLQQQQQPITIAPMPRKPMALVEQLLSASEHQNASIAQSVVSVPIASDPPSPSVPLIPFGQRGLVKRHFTYGALQQQSKRRAPARRSLAPKPPSNANSPLQVATASQLSPAPPPLGQCAGGLEAPSTTSSRVSCTNGPEVKMTASTVRRCLQQLLNEPDMTIDTPLFNNETAGEFSIKYILMHAQKRENKRGQK